METNPAILVREVFTYFENTQRMLNDVLTKNFSGKDKFQILIDRTFAEILEGSRSEIEKGIYYSLEQIDRYRDVRFKNVFGDYLYYELSFFNSRYNYIEPQMEILNEIKAEEKIEVASTVLSSIKDLFDRLPKWLQNVITVISEILGIAKSIV